MPVADRFASAWPELIIACDVRGRNEWLHCCRWPPLQLACAAYRLFAHAFRLQTDLTTGLHIASFAFTGGRRKKHKIKVVQIFTSFIAVLGITSKRENLYYFLQWFS